MLRRHSTRCPRPLHPENRRSRPQQRTHSLWRYFLDSRAIHPASGRTHHGDLYASVEHAQRFAISPRFRHLARSRLKDIAPVRPTYVQAVSADEEDVQRRGKGSIAVPYYADPVTRLALIEASTEFIPFSLSMVSFRTNLDRG